CEQGYIFPFTF
nr:immunoglobulin light chain junction region [Macaca mulatta]